MQKRILLAFAATMLFFWLWAWVGDQMGYVPEKPDPEAAGEVASDSTEDVPPNDSREESTAATGEQASAEPAADEPPPVPEKTIAREHVVLANELVRMSIDNRGGVVDSVILLGFYESALEEKLLELVGSERHAPGEVILARDLSTRDRMFEIVSRTDSEVVLEHRGRDATIRKTYRLGDDYLLHLDVAVTGTTDPGFHMVVAEGLQPIAPDEKLTTSFLDFGAINPKIMFYTWSEGGDSEKKGVKDKYPRTSFLDIENEESIDWLGIKDNYFAGVFMPDAPIRNAGYKVTEKFFPTTNRSIDLPVMALRAEQEIGGSFYFGPIKEAELERVSHTLENLVDYGYAGLLSRWLFYGLDFFHGLTGNWGWAIVCLTLVIRFLLVPLMIPSVKSSYKMRKLQPKLKKIQEKYKGNDMESKQKLQKEMWGLYKQEGVNPFSSCFTMLLQMPVFFAYFSLLRSSIYLRQAEWMFWINDLSVKDPTYVLPIIMGATMFLSTSAMPMAGADPAQQKMMKVMPVLFSLMFIGMPAGLILYMITGNIFTLIQTKVLNRRFASQ